MESYSLRPPHLTNGAAFGILSVFLLPGGNGSVCSASKTMEDAGQAAFFIFCMEIINMAWVMLGIAGIFEVVWATCMKCSEGFIKLSCRCSFAGMAVSFFLLARATKTLPLGTAYAVWTGHWRAGLRDRWLHLVQRAGDSRAAHFCCTAAYRHHRSEDHVGMIHTIILPRPARRCAAAILNEPSDVQSVDEPVVYLERPRPSTCPLALAMIFAPDNARDGVVSVKIALIGQRRERDPRADS